MVIDSYLEVYTIRPSGHVESYRQIDNAFGGAMHIWLRLAKKYQVPLSLLPNPVPSLTQLWASIVLMEEADQWILAMTFDKVIIRREHLPMLLTHLNTFLSSPGNETKTLAQLRDTMIEVLADTAVEGLCFNQTDAAQSFWVKRRVDRDEDRPYNLVRDKGHWYLTPEYLKKRQEEANGKE